MKCFNNDVSSPMYDYILTDYNCCSPLSGRLSPELPRPQYRGHDVRPQRVYEARLPPFRTTLRTQQQDESISRPAMRVHPQCRPDPAQAQHALWQPATAIEPPPTMRDGTRQIQVTR